MFSLPQQSWVLGLAEARLDLRHQWRPANTQHNPACSESSLTTSLCTFINVFFSPLTPRLDSWMWMLPSTGVPFQTINRNWKKMIKKQSLQTTPKWAQPQYILHNPFVVHLYFHQRGLITRCSRRPHSIAKHDALIDRWNCKAIHFFLPHLPGHSTAP